MNEIAISALSREQIERAMPLLRSSRQKPYRFLQNLPGDLLDSFWLQEIAELSEKPGGRVLAAVRKDQVVGLAACADLPWDTGVIGRGIGALKYLLVAPDLPEKQAVLDPLLDHTEGWASSQGIELLLCQVYTNDMPAIHALEQQGFLLMDTQLDYVYDSVRDPLPTVPPPRLAPGARIRLADENDVEELIAMAQATFQSHFGRYHSDPRIPRRQATRVYQEWMRSSCGGYGDWVLVAEVDGAIAGCSVWKKPSPLESSMGIPIGHYSIGAVHPDYYRRGFFSILTYEGMKLFDGIADCVKGPTHVNNYSVQRAYHNLRWRICDARHSFHRWLVQ